MVINKFGDRLYNGLVDTITRHLAGISQRIEEAQGDGFLREIKARWDNHNKSMQMIRDILMVRVGSAAASLSPFWHVSHPPPPSPRPPGSRPCRPFPSL